MRPIEVAPDDCGLWLAIGHDCRQSRHGRAVDQVKVRAGNLGLHRRLLSLSPSMGHLLCALLSPIEELLALLRGESVPSRQSERPVAPLQDWAAHQHPTERDTP